MHFGFAGAGFSGAVMARELAEAGHTASIFDTRSHIGGNCYTERDEDTGINIHRYGPHIFHTDSERVWDYVNRFGVMRRFNHRVLTTTGGRVYSMPINLLTINQLFGTTFSPEEAQAFIAEQADSSIDEPANFEEQALKMVGRRIYEAFFYGYTKKQWGMEPTRLPASILKRLPVRFNFDDSYFNHPYQAIPEGGYTGIIEGILDHPAITVQLEAELKPADRGAYDHIVWSGPLDAWFGYTHGRLGYRTVDFEEIRADGDYLGTSVMNFGDFDVPHTRIHEHKHFAPWETHDKTVCFREVSRQHEPGDIPYYPIRLVDDKELLSRYLDDAAGESGVSFVGRLGTYRYLDMDVTIREALEAGDAVKAAIAANEPIAPFFVDPR